MDEIIRNVKTISSETASTFHDVQYSIFYERVKGDVYLFVDNRLFKRVNIGLYQTNINSYSCRLFSSTIDNLRWCNNCYVVYEYPEGCQICKHTKNNVKTNYCVYNVNSEPLANVYKSYFNLLCDKSWGNDELNDLQGMVGEFKLTSERKENMKKNLYNLFNKSFDKNSKYNNMFNTLLESIFHEDNNKEETKQEVSENSEKTEENEKENLDNTSNNPTDHEDNMKNLKNVGIDMFKHIFKSNDPKTDKMVDDLFSSVVNMTKNENDTQSNSLNGFFKQLNDSFSKVNRDEENSDSSFVPINKTVDGKIDVGSSSDEN